MLKPVKGKNSMLPDDQPDNNADEEIDAAFTYSANETEQITEPIGTPRVQKRLKFRRGSEHLAQLLFDSEIRLNAFRDAVLDAVRDLSSSLEMDSDSRKLSALEDHQLISYFKSLLNIYGIPKPTESNLKTSEELISVIEEHIEALNNAIMNVSDASDEINDTEGLESCKLSAHEMLQEQKILLEASQKIQSLEKDRIMLSGERDYLQSRLHEKESEIAELEFSNSILHDSVASMQTLLDRAVLEIENLRLADSEAFPVATVACVNSFDSISYRALETETLALREKVKCLEAEASENQVVLRSILDKYADASSQLHSLHSKSVQPNASSSSMSPGFRDTPEGKLQFSLKTKRLMNDFLSRISGRETISEVSEFDTSSEDGDERDIHDASLVNFYKAGVRAQRKEREKKLGTLREERLETVRIAISNTERHVPKVSGGKVSFKSPTAQNSPEERTSCYEEDSEDDNDCSFGPLSDSPAEEHADSVLEQISSFLTLSPSSPT